MPNIGYKNGKAITIGGATGGPVPGTDTAVHGRAIYVGSASTNLAYQTAMGDDIYLVNIPIGLHELPHRKIYGTSNSTIATSATGVISFT